MNVAAEFDSAPVSPPALLMSPRDGCIEWLDREAARIEASPTSLGGLGLWRWRCSAGVAERVFALPRLPQALLSATLDETAAFDADAQGEEQAEQDVRLSPEVRDWVEATRRGALPRDWRAPDPGEAATWLDAGRMSLRAGQHLAKAELDCRSDRLRVVCAEVARLPGELDPARRAWLQAICEDVQQHWQLLRLEPEQGVVRAEVDLSGVPARLAEPLVVLAFEGLARGVASALAPLRLLCDPELSAQVFSSRPLQGGSAPLRRSHRARKKEMAS